MPLIETLTLLASLGSAVQALRKGPTDERTGGKDESSTGLLLSYEYVKTSQESAVREDGSIIGRLLGLLLISGVVTGGSGVIGAASVEGAGAGSPLFIVALILLGVIAIATALAIAFRPALIATEDVVARQAVLGEWEFLRDMLAQAARLERANRRLIATKTIALGVMCLFFAAQVILVSVWALEA